MTRAMPVCSTSCPSSTNSGTASKMSELMPSSIRPTTTSSGVRVVVSRKATVARQKENAIGTPAITAQPSRPTKKISRFQLPSGFSEGPAR